MDVYISTHALREEGDDTTAAPDTRASPFLPTPSARRATEVAKDETKNKQISTHALREEGDAGPLQGAAK